MMGNYQVRFLEGPVAAMQLCLLGEHRLFSYISKNWRGKPLITREVVISLIANTRTTKGLEVQAVLDQNEYQSGLEVTEAEIIALNITGDKFHPEWNYTISPRQHP